MSEKPTDQHFDLMTANPVYKPFRYPWAYDAWLTQQRVHWLPEEIPLADDVKDWHRALTEAERHLITQIFRFFTQADCYPRGTSILTPSGWKTFETLSDTDKVAQVHPDGRIEFVRPLDRLIKPFKGNLLQFKAERKAVDFTVTPTHGVWYEYKGEWKREKASSVKLFQNKRLRVAGYGVGDKIYLTPMERLAIAFQADGNTKADCDGSRIGGIRHYFGFSKPRKIERMYQILEDTGLEYSVDTEERASGTYTLFNVLLPERMDKNFDWVKLDTISSAWAKDFIEEVGEWDSHRDEWGWIHYSNTNQAAAEKVQAVSLLCGKDATRRLREDNRKDIFSDIHKVSIGDKDMLDGQHVVKTEVPYEGDVYCVTVPTGAILVCQNGKPIVSGNCEVNSAYMKHYSQVFKPTEVLMMLSSFSNIETIHIAAYSHLLDTIGMPETEYSAFLKYKEMKDKYDFMQSFSIDNKREIAKTMAAFGAFMEGLQLFASFAILLNFPRFNKLKGMGQIVSWSVRDETLHCLSMIRLFRTFIQENPELWTEDFKDELTQICRTTVDHEDAFIDLAFEMGPVEGMSSDDVKAYIRFIADRRLIQLGLTPIYNQGANPLPWIDDMLNAVEHANFFESRSTEYTRGATAGIWDDDAFTAPGEPVIFTIPEGCPFCDGVKQVWDDLERPVRVIEVADPVERQRLYDTWGLTGYDRTMPKAIREDGTLLKTSNQIEDWLEANYSP